MYSFFKYFSFAILFASSWFILYSSKLIELLRSVTLGRHEGLLEGVLVGCFVNVCLVADQRSDLGLHELLYVGLGAVLNLVFKALFDDVLHLSKVLYLLYRWDLETCLFREAFRLHRALSSMSWCENGPLCSWACYHGLLGRLSRWSLGIQSSFIWLDVFSIIKLEVRFLRKTLLEKLDLSSRLKHLILNSLALSVVQSISPSFFVPSIIDNNLFRFLKAVGTLGRSNWL